MGLFAVLELLIGLAFVYFLLGLMATVIREIQANLLNLRAKNLEAWLENAVDRELKEKILSHKLIDGLTAAGRRASFYPTRCFVDALLDIIREEQGKGTYTIETLQKSIEKSVLLPDDLRRAMLQYISEAKGNLEELRKRIGNWFDEAMIRITGTYKRYARMSIFWAGMAIAAAVNADTIELARYFHDNPLQRMAMADKVDLLIDSGELEALKQAYLLEGDSLLSKRSTPLDSLQAEIRVFHELNQTMANDQLPLGWSAVEGWSDLTPGSKTGWILSKVLGILLSTLAISLGAPFWYDILGKLVNLRAAGKPPASPG